MFVTLKCAKTNHGDDFVTRQHAKTMNLQDRTGCPSMKTKLRSTWRNISERTMTTIQRNTFPIRQKYIFSSLGYFEYFRELSWEYLPYHAKNAFFHPWAFLNISERLFWEYLPYYRQKNNIFFLNPWALFEFFGETILRITSLPGKKSIFSSVGSFEYFRETILRIPSLSGKKRTFF